MVTQTTLVNHSLPELLTEARCKLLEYDGSPYSIRSSREIEIDPNFLLNFYSTGAEGSKVTFLYFRQSFASHFAAQSIFKFIFQKKLSVMSSLCLFEDFLKLAIPGFFYVQMEFLKYL